MDFPGSPGRCRIMSSTSQACCRVTMSQDCGPGWRHGRSRIAPRCKSDNSRCLEKVQSWRQAPTARTAHTSRVPLCDHAWSVVNETQTITHGEKGLAMDVTETLSVRDRAQWCRWLLKHEINAQIPMRVSAIRGASLARSFLKSTLQSNIQSWSPCGSRIR